MSEPADSRPDGAGGIDSQIDQQAGKQYWEGISADVDGMLGGFPFVSRVDLQGSRNFLAKFGIGTKQGQRTLAGVLEGGAGYVSFYISCDNCVAAARW